MTIAPVCDRCGSELSDFGALLFSPPEEGKARKFHLCKKCYKAIIGTFMKK